MDFWKRGGTPSSSRFGMFVRDESGMFEPVVVLSQWVRFMKSRSVSPRSCTAHSHLSGSSAAQPVSAHCHALLGAVAADLAGGRHE